jgi:hypothetical protein
MTPKSVDGEGVTVAAGKVLPIAEEVCVVESVVDMTSGVLVDGLLLSPIR